MTPALRTLGAALLGLVLLFVGTPLSAQNGVQQVGPIIPGHSAAWRATGQIEDSGAAAGGVSGTFGDATHVPQCTYVAGQAASCATVAIGGALSLPFLKATDYGVVADGATTNDAAMNNAVAACAAIGGALYLPAGGIKLTGLQSISLHDCNLVGAGTFNGAGQNFGTTFLFTSTTQKPFICGSNWRIQGVNFFYPNQTSGTTLYPPLFSDNGSVGCGFFSIDNVNIVNAYDVFSATGNLSWGGIRISNSQMYALHVFWKQAYTGDYVLISNTILDPGVWLNMTNFAAGTVTAINAADQVNKIFEIATNGGGPDANKAASFTLKNVGAFAWRYGFFVDSGGLLNGGTEVTWDGVGTYLDTSSGGGLANFVMSCPTGGCIAGIATYPTGATTVGNNPMFNLGAGSGALTLNDFHVGQAQGSIVVTAGQSVAVKNSDFAAWGNINDGSEYYTVHATANTGGTSVRFENSQTFPNASTHYHGIKADVALSEEIVQNSKFANVNDALSLVLGGGFNVITGNYSSNTQGAASVLSSGAGAVVYGENEFDKPPLVSVTNCGAGASGGGIPGVIVTVGSTNPTTSCDVTMPFTLKNGYCVFNPNSAMTLGYTIVASTPQTYRVVTGADIHGGQIFGNCASGQ
jgi:hypothetical protein